jgi:hypothetical protein
MLTSNQKERYIGRPARTAISPRASVARNVLILSRDKWLYLCLTIPWLRSVHCRSTTNLLIEYPSTPPTNTSDGKCDDKLKRENPTTPANP